MTNRCCREILDDIRTDQNCRELLNVEMANHHAVLMTSLANHLRSGGLRTRIAGIVVKMAALACAAEACRSAADPIELES